MAYMTAQQGDRHVESENLARIIVLGPKHAECQEKETDE